MARYFSIKVKANTNNQNQRSNSYKRCDRYSIWKTRKNKVLSLHLF